MFVYARPVIIVFAISKFFLCLGCFEFSAVHLANKLCVVPQGASGGKPDRRMTWSSPTAASAQAEEQIEFPKFPVSVSGMLHSWSSKSLPAAADPLNRNALNAPSPQEPYSNFSSG